MENSTFLENTPYAIVISSLIVAALLWRLKPAAFRTLPWQSFGIASALFWGVFAALIISLAWDAYYKFFVPPWYRLAAPIGSIVLYSSMAVLFRGISIRLPGNPVLWFCLLGGLESIPEHAIGVFRFHILEIPVLAGSSVESVILFAFFEYVIYWCVVLVVAIGIGRIIRSSRRGAVSGTASSKRRSG